jgi:2-polyprenyl-3-methyl-5-hydroxy-6-metoxy-1,4-benzoquinol methylase
MDLKEAALVDPMSHWYYQSKLFALVRSVERFSPEWKSLIDVGAGSGFFSRSIADFKKGQQVICVDPNYELEQIEKEGNLRLLKNPPINGGDIYLFMDVLEHVVNDVELLTQYTNNAQPGAKVFITVPAFMSMWSTHDEYLEHFRRYRLSEIVDVANRAGLKIVHKRYLFGLVFPAAWLVRRYKRSKKTESDLTSTNRYANAILRVILKCEHKFWWNPVFGVSAFVVAEVTK